MEDGGRVNAPPLRYHRSYKRLPYHFVPRNDVVVGSWFFCIRLHLLERGRQFFGIARAINDRPYSVIGELYHCAGAFLLFRIVLRNGHNRSLHKVRTKSSKGHRQLSRLVGVGSATRPTGMG